ncbi:YcjF family protein [Aquabacter cavernae]|uniref:YcjF family protein n=1 Tax=Aquabacter cavernae TaxID=2496029 RepID=UPI000F8F667E|nr:TIGR01620 family protein [Aquabacter cavernae]
MAKGTNTRESSGEAARPQVFRLDEAGITFAEAEPMPDELALPVTVPAPPARSRLGLGTLFWAGLGGLVSLGTGLAVSKLVEDLFARADWLGYVGLSFAALFGAATLAIICREGLALARLSSLDAMRTRAMAALAADDRPEAEAVTRDLLSLTATMPALARPRAELSSHLGAIIDGADLVRLTERTLMAPLDARASQMVSDAAKQVSVVTAVSPRAAVDLLFVFYTALTLMRRLSRLYGGRPGALGMIRLVRHVVSHLAVTGGMAAGDSLIQQVVGHGLAARLSARLGEGVVNGLLTARLGLAAIAVTRPLPFAALPAPRIADVASGLVRSAQDAETQAEPQAGIRRVGKAPGE